MDGYRYDTPTRTLALWQSARGTDTLLIFTES